MSTPAASSKPLMLRITQWAILLSLTTPLVVAPNSLIFPFVTPKAWFFQTCILIAAVSYLLLIRVDRTYRPRKNALTMTVIIFIAVMALAAITGVDFQRSIWANHERMLGVFTITHFIVFYLITTSVFRTRGEWRWFWRIFLGVGAVVLLSAAIQHWYPDFLYGGARAASTLGNPLYLGLYAVYIGFVTCTVWFDNFLGSFVGWWRKWQSWAVLFLLGLSFFAFFLAETRGVFVGVGVALLWMLAFVASAAGTRKVRLGALGLLLFFALGVGFFITTSDHPAFAHIPGLRRFADRSLASGTNANRIFAWHVAVDAWRARPILGWGPFNYVYAFNEQYQGTQLVHNEFGETWFDNAHNFFLDTLATEGLFGFFAYLALFVIPIFLLIRGWRRGNVPLPFAVLLSGLLVMHAVQNIFAFEQITSYVTFFAVMSFVYQVVYHGKKESDEETKQMYAPKGSPTAVYSVIVIALACVIWYKTDFIPFSANHTMFSALGSLETRQDADEWFTLHKKAVDMDSPYGDHTREELARTLLRVQVTPNGDKKFLVGIFQYAIGEMDKAADRHPRDPVYHMLKGELWYGAHVLMPNDFAEGPALGERAFLAAVQQSPERQQLYLLWSQHRLQAGDIAGGLELLRKARSFAPNSAFMLRLYAEYLDSARVNAPESARVKDLAWRLSPSLYSIHEAERIGLSMARWVSGLRGTNFLRTILACRGEETGLTCPEVYVGAAYNPSQDVFGAITAYYTAAHDTASLAKYVEIAHHYFPDFTPEKASPPAKK